MQALLGIKWQHLHMSRGLKHFVGSKHGALECHHLLRPDKVLAPDLDDLVLKALEWRAVVEQTLRGGQLLYSKECRGKITLTEP